MCNQFRDVVQLTNEANVLCNFNFVLSKVIIFLSVFLHCPLPFSLIVNLIVLSLKIYGFMK